MADKSASRRVDADLIRSMAELLAETGLGEIEYGEGDWRVRVAAPRAAAVSIPVPVPAPASPLTAPCAPAAPGGIEEHPGALRSPMVGFVYTAPEPDAPSFVKVGDAVKAGDTVLLIEAMKVFNPIAAPQAGTVTRILITSGDPVEYGEPLIVIE